jgi:hypothetical protein
MLLVFINEAIVDVVQFPDMIRLSVMKGHMIIIPNRRS